MAYLQHKIFLGHLQRNYKRIFIIIIVTAMNIIK